MLVTVDRRLQTVGVADRLDDVRLGVGDAVELHRAAGALDAGGGDDPLAGDRDRLGATGPQRVDDGLDVLLVHDEGVGVVARVALLDLRGRVTQHDLHAGAAVVGGAGRVGELRGLVPELLDVLVGHAAGHLVHLALQVGELGLEAVVADPLAVDERRQVLVAARTQVGAVRVHETHRQQAATEQHHDGRTKPPGGHAGPALWFRGGVSLGSGAHDH